MHTFSKWYNALRDFTDLSKSIERQYLERINQKNRVLIFTAAILTIALECAMLMRLFAIQPTLSTQASKVYFMFYISLIAISVAAIVLQPYVTNHSKRQYWFHFTCTAAYLLWNVLLCSYDLRRSSGNESALTIIMAIVFASILMRFRPHHMIILQWFAYTLFLLINYKLITDTINANIALLVALLANILFYYQQVRSVHHELCIHQMHARIEASQLEGARQYLRRLHLAQEQTAIYHHDMRHTLQLLEQFLQQNELEKLGAFISQSQEKLAALTTTVYCEHETANLILGAFDERAQENDIAFRYEVSLPASLPIEDTELCALLSNLLENALNAAQRPQTPNPYIYVRAVYHNHNLVILVENSFDGQVQLAHDRPVPRTPDAAHGFGTQSIIDIADRHQGLSHFEPQGTVFQAKVLLQL